MKKLLLIGALLLVAAWWFGLFEGNKNPYVTQENTLERSLEKAIKDGMGATTNWDTPRVVSVRTIEQADNKGIAADLRVRINENVTSSATGKGFAIAMRRLMPELLKNKDLATIQEFRFFGSLRLVDNKGNQKEEPVTKAIITRKHAEKVGWENLLNEEIPGVFKMDGDFWFHPAVRPDWQ